MVLVSSWLLVAHIPLFNSTRQYFISRRPARLLAPTLRPLRASISVFQLVLSLVVNQVLSISRRRSLGSVNCVLILSRVLVLTLSCSPRWYHCADTSRTSSSTQPRSSKVSLCPGRSEIAIRVVYTHKYQYQLIHIGHWLWWAYKVTHSPTGPGLISISPLNNSSRTTTISAALLTRTQRTEKET